jgi:hypothetical protein
MSRAPLSAGFRVHKLLPNTQRVQFAAPEQPRAVVQRMDRRDCTALGGQSQRLRTDAHVDRGVAQGVVSKYTNARKRLA